MNFPIHSVVDFQPYLLPGTDPWSLPEEKAVSLLNYLSYRGYKHAYCIPPVKSESQFITTDAIQNIFLSFLRSFAFNCDLELAARYRLDEGFLSLLNNHELLTIGEYLIVDVSPIQAHEDTFSTLEAITKAGYTPILVQPERTTYWKGKDFLQLKRVGCRLMLNLYSLFGYNGDNALMFSRWMLSNGMYDYVCSGAEDTKIMQYSEQFVLNENDSAIKEIARLEENGRILWSTTK